MGDKTVTHAQVCNNKACPVCESTNITSNVCPNNTKQSYPKCDDCGYTVGSSGGSVDGGIWIAYPRLSFKQTYKIYGV